MKEFEEKFNEWIEKVKAAKENGCSINTYRMIADIDKIIAEGFDHLPVLDD